MLRIAVQAKGRLYEETMSLLTESGIKLESGKRLLLLPARNFPIEVLFLRDDDIPQSVADGVADIGIVGENVDDVLNPPAQLGFTGHFKKYPADRGNSQVAAADMLEGPELGAFLKMQIHLGDFGELRAHQFGQMAGQMTDQKAGRALARWQTVAIF